MQKIVHRGNIYNVKKLNTKKMRKLSLLGFFPAHDKLKFSEKKTSNF